MAELYSGVAMNVDSPKIVTPPVTINQRKTTIPIFLNYKKNDTPKEIVTPLKSV